MLLPPLCYRVPRAKAEVVRNNRLRRLYSSWSGPARTHALEGVRDSKRRAPKAARAFARDLDPKLAGLGHFSLFRGRVSIIGGNARLLRFSANFHSYQLGRFPDAPRKTRFLVAGCFFLRRAKRDG